MHTRTIEVLIRRHRPAFMSSAQFPIVSDLHLETYPSYDGFKSRKSAGPSLATSATSETTAFPLSSKSKPRGTGLSSFSLVIASLAILTSQTQSPECAPSPDRMEAKRRTPTIGRFIFLGQTRYDMPGYRLTTLGCTHFSHITKEQATPVASRFVSFKDIVDWIVEQHNLAHQSDLEWLNAEVAKITREQPTRNIAIFTHHSPCSAKKATRPKHRNSEVSSGL